MQINKIYNTDCIYGLKELPDQCVDVCVTSPPYFNLRDYGNAGQIGLEKTPEEYIEKLVEVFREVRRVLKDDGTLWVNIGDSYATSSGNQPPRNTRNRNGHTAKVVPSGYKRKDLIGIPWMLAFALRADGWYLRQDIIWNKTNCMPESVKDRCTKSHEYVFLLSKQPSYYFDAAAISEPIAESSRQRYTQNIAAQRGSDRQPGKTNGTTKAVMPRFDGRRNKRTVWSLHTARYKGAHFATFPEELVRPCILAGSPIGGTVLDPFAGSGTTAVVALKNSRNFIGFEISAEYCSLSENRIREANAQMTMQEEIPL